MLSRGVNLRWLNVFLSLLLALSTLPSSATTHKSMPSKPHAEIIELTGANTVVLGGVIEPVAVDTFTAAVIAKRSILPPGQVLYILIASPGGDVEAALTLQRVLENIPNSAVICKYCLSAASYLFITARQPRLAIDSSYMLNHQMYQPHFTAKDSLDAKGLEMFRKESDYFDKQIYTRLGITKAQYEENIVDTEWILEGEDLVKNKAADKIVTLRCNKYMEHLAPNTCQDG